jgi:cytoskeletal protein RodZ
MRPRGGTTRRRDDQQEQSPAATAEAIGKQLRRAREDRGLDLLSVHDRLSRPITQIEALERGELNGLPDQAVAISTLRRYATFLGLDGDALALQYIDAWPAAPDGSAAADRTRVNQPVTGVVAAVTTGPDHLRAFTQTGQVPRVGGRSTSAAGPGSSGYEVSTGPPTGTFPVLPRNELRQSRRALARERRRMRAPTSLKLVTWIAVVLVAAVLAGFVLLAVRPNLLASARILRVVEPGAAPPATAGLSSPLATAPPVTSGSTSPPVSSGTTAPPATGRSAGHGRAHRQTAAVQSAGSSANSASYAVADAHFTVAVATSGPCWVQITSSSSPVPLVSAVEPGGKILAFPSQGTMTVQVGSSRVLVGVTVKGKNALLIAPTTTPFTYVFSPAP